LTSDLRTHPWEFRIFQLTSRLFSNNFFKGRVGLSMNGRNRFYFGWAVVGFSFITLALAYGTWYAYSVFFVALLKEFGWSRSIGAGAFSIAIIVSSLIAPFVGAMVHSAGPRMVIIGGSLVFGIGCMLCSLTRTWWEFYLFFGFIAAIGLGAAGYVPNVTLVQIWFKEKKGLPMGIISAGIGVGILVCVPSIQHLIDWVGWRATYRIIALFVPLVILFGGIPLLRKPPQTTTLSHSEKDISPTVIKDSLIVDEVWTSQRWTVRKAIATKQFWFVSLCIFSSSVLTQSLFTHQVAFFVDRGLETLVASYIVGVVGIVSVGFKILWGALSDRIGREITFTMGISFYIFTLIILILFNYFPSSYLTYFYSAFFGIGYAVTASLTPLISADLFQGQGFGGIFGSLMIFTGLGGAWGTWFAGFLYDRTGTYVPVFVILIVFALAACLSVWQAAPRKIRTVPGRRVKFIPTLPTGRQVFPL
jgi:MFS family permease